MNATIVYRRAVIEDLPAVWRVRTDSIRVLCRSRYDEQQTEAWASAPAPDDFSEVIRTRDFLVADRESAVVGFGFINRNAAVLEALFVAPEFGRQGIGRALLTLLEQIARQAGLPALGLSSSLNAVPFYQAAGYHAIAETTWRHPAGFELPCVEMTKAL